LDRAVHELELWARAGIPNGAILRAATLGSAEVNRRAGERGVLAPGWLADLILVDGDPLANISDIRKVRTVIKDGVVLDAAASQLAVMRWRGGNPAIVRFWYALGNAVVGAISTPGMKFKAHATEVRVWRGNLHIRKPNGDTLVYHRPAIVDGDITFWGVDQKTKRWVLQRTYGGKLVENLTQAVARDLLAEAMVDIENDWGVVPVLHVHDELVYEVESLTQAKQLQEAAEFVPAWAKGLPLSSGMQLGERYRK